MSGSKYEHFKLCLEHEEATELLTQAAQHLAQAKVPSTVAEALRVARLTALTKRTGGVRGIATGEVLRRLVSRTLAQQFGHEVSAACMPYQFALNTRAGTDCIGLLLRALTDLDEDLVVVSLDGIGAYDHIKRSAMLSKLRKLPRASAMLPFVRLFYGAPSEYTWYDDEGVAHAIIQGDGGEQGDPLMPALYSLGQHDALHMAAQELHQDDHVFAFLDDLYVVTRKSRAREAIDIVTGKVHELAGVRTHLGKLEAWSAAGGTPPPRLQELSATAWKGNLPEHLNGLVVLGSPLGHAAFVQEHAQARQEEENRLLEELPKLEDLQAAWALLLHCAAPRANHLLRLLPPSVSGEYARGHDEALRRCLSQLLEQKQCLGERSAAWSASTLPQRSGGLGLRSAERTAPAAYFGAWADALPELQRRSQALANALCRDLEAGSEATAAC